VTDAAAMRFVLLEADQEVARAAAGEWNSSVRDDGPVRLRSATALVVLKRQHCRLDIIAGGCGSGSSSRRQQAAAGGSRRQQAAAGGSSSSIISITAAKAEQQHDRTAPHLPPT
jgi:hypothetical protein